MNVAQFFSLFDILHESAEIYALGFGTVTTNFGNGKYYYNLASESAYTNT